MTTLITVDLGNSRCKLVRWSGVQRSEAFDAPAAEVLAVDALTVDAASVAEGGEGLARLSIWLASVTDGSCALSSVASPALEERVRGALEARLGAGSVARPDHALALDSPEPDGIGTDRLFAARGAVERVRASVVVVDAGTALTVDAVRVDDASQSGGLVRATFLGGAIAAGPRLLADALAAGTARLPRVAPEPGPKALGRTTVEAIRSGVGIGFRGAALELVRRVAEEAGLSGAPVLITGGAAGFLDGPGGLGGFGGLWAERVDDLVHLGLRCAWRARRDARGA